MKLWVGQYVGAPDQWFLAWGDTKLEAAAFVDAMWGEPDLRSMRVVDAPGAFNFALGWAETEDGDEEVVFVNADDGEEELALAVDDDELADWMVRATEDPLPTPEGARQREAIERAATEEPADVVPDCPCFWERDVLNFPCEQYEASPAAPGECVYCEHAAGCHPAHGVRR